MVHRIRSRLKEIKKWNKGFMWLEDTHEGKMQVNENVKIDVGVN